MEAESKASSLAVAVETEKEACLDQQDLSNALTLTVDQRQTYEDELIKQVNSLREWVERLQGETRSLGGQDYRGSTDYRGRQPGGALTWDGFRHGERVTVDGASSMAATGTNIDVDL